MGWRDRDWAKFTPEEFDAIYGGGSSSTLGSTPDRDRRRGRRIGWIIVISLVGSAVIFGIVIAAGRTNSSSSIARGGATPIVIPSAPLASTVAQPKARRVGLITGPRIFHVGDRLRLHGSHEPEAGSIVIRARWNSGPWFTAGVARGQRRAFTLAIPLDRHGVLHVKIVNPDGYTGVGTYQVR